MEKLKSSNEQGINDYTDELTDVAVESELKRVDLRMKLKEEKSTNTIMGMKLERIFPYVVSLLSILISCFSLGITFVVALNEKSRYEFEQGEVYPSFEFSKEDSIDGTEYVLINSKGTIDNLNFKKEDEVTVNYTYNGAYFSFSINVGGCIDTRKETKASKDYYYIKCPYYYSLEEIEEKIKTQIAKEFGNVDLDFFVFAKSNYHVFYLDYKHEPHFEEFSVSLDGGGSYKQYESSGQTFIGIVGVPGNTETDVTMTLVHCIINHLRLQFNRNY